MKTLQCILFFLISFHILGDITPSFFENEEYWSKKNIDNVTIYYEKNENRVPILCFHIIGDLPRYEISAQNFDTLLKYLNKNKFYPISDKQFILKDFSSVPTGYKPIVLGSDDASEGNFIYKTTTSDSLNGSIDYTSGKAEIDENSMVGILERNLNKQGGRINFTFYVSFNGVPFRQTGGEEVKGAYYRGLDVLDNKFNYILNNFYLGIHTVTHPVTKDTKTEDFKWEIDEFYNIMNSYVGDKINLINTIAYPYGCGSLSLEMKNMIENYNYKGVQIIGGFDFDGYFSSSPFTNRVNNYDISRLGVDNQNIENVYNFLESIKLFESKRVIVVRNESDLHKIQFNNEDIIVVGQK